MDTLSFESHDSIYIAASSYIEASAQSNLSKDDLDRLAFYTEEAVTITDEQANILRVNQAFTRITGYTEAEVLGKNPRILQSGRQSRAFYESMWASILSNGSWQGRIWNRRKNGDIYAEWLSICLVTHPSTSQHYYVAHFMDLHEVTLEVEKWRDLAYHDPLTGAYNRTYLLERFTSWSGRIPDMPIVLALIDLDRFKSINDLYGHEAGDIVLKAVVSQILQAMRPTDELVRIGGDEFLLIMGGTVNISMLSAIGERLVNAIHSPIPYKTHMLSVGVSIGIVISTEVDPFESLYHRADLAMYKAKQQGGGYLVFDPSSGNETTIE